jgi:hypothetical protein
MYLGVVRLMKLGVAEMELDSDGYLGDAVVLMVPILGALPCWSRTISFNQRLPPAASRAPG